MFSISKLIVANSLPVEVDAITSYGKSTSNSAKSVPGIVNNLAISLLLCWNLTSSKALHEVSDDIWINHYSLQLGLVTFGWLWGHLPFASLRVVERCICLLFGSLTKPGLKINITYYFICFLRGPSLIGFPSSFLILVICLFYCPILDLYVMCLPLFYSSF